MKLVCGVMEPGLHQHLATLDVFALGAAQQQRRRCRRPALVEQLAEHFDTGTGGLGSVGLIPTISISSPTLMTPRSIRPVTTVPRPEIERRLRRHQEGPSTARSASGCSCPGVSQT